MRNIWNSGILGFYAKWLKWSKSEPRVYKEIYKEILSVMISNYINNGILPVT